MKNLLAIFIFVIITSGATAYAQDAGTAADRLNELKNKQATTISEAQKAMIITICTGTQQKISDTQKASNTAVRKRLLLYGTIQKELKAIELRMTKQGVDASELDLLIGKLQQNLDELALANRSAQQVTDDILLIDCKAQPELYSAGITELQQNRALLLNTASSLKKDILLAPEETFNPLIERLKI